MVRPTTDVRKGGVALELMYGGPNDSGIDSLSTGPLARLFVRSLAPDCSLRLRPPLRSLVRSLAHFAHSLARGKEVFCNEMNASITFSFNPLIKEQDKRASGEHLLEIPSLTHHGTEESQTTLAVKIAPYSMGTSFGMTSAVAQINHSFANSMQVTYRILYI